MSQLNKKGGPDDGKTKKTKPHEDYSQTVLKKTDAVLSGGNGGNGDNGDKLETLSREKIIKIIEGNQKTFFWDFDCDLLKKLYSEKETRSIGLPKEIFSEKVSTFFTGNLVINIDGVSGYLKHILKGYFEAYEKIENIVPDSFFTKVEQLIDTYLAKKPDKGDESKYTSYAVIYVKILAIISSPIFMGDNRCIHTFEKLAKLKESQPCMGELYIEYDKNFENEGEWYKLRDGFGKQHIPIIKSILNSKKFMENITPESKENLLPCLLQLLGRIKEKNT